MRRDFSKSPDHQITKSGVFSVDRIRRKRRQGYGEVFRAFTERRAVADHLAWVGDDRLSGTDVDHTALVLDADHPLQHDGVLVELRPLTRLTPASGRAHVGDADGGGGGV